MLFRKSKPELSTPNISVEEAARILQSQREDFGKKLKSIDDTATMDWQDILGALQKQELLDEYNAKIHQHPEKMMVMGIFAIGALFSVAIRASNIDLIGIAWLAWVLFIASFALIPEWVAFHLWIRKPQFLGNQRRVASVVLVVCMSFSIMGIMSLIGLIRHDQRLADLYFTYINPMCLSLIFIKDWVIHSLSPSSKMKRKVETQMERLMKIESRRDEQLLNQIEHIYEQTAQEYMLEKHAQLQREQHAPTEYDKLRRELAQLYGEEAIAPLSDRDLMMYQKAISDQNLTERIRKMRMELLNTQAFVSEMVTKGQTIQHDANAIADENISLKRRIEQLEGEKHESVHLENVNVHSDYSNERSESVQLTVNAQPENARALHSSAIQNAQVYTKSCEWCSVEFQTRRSDARFCSASHRTRANEAKKAQKEAENTLLDSVAVG